MTISTVSIIIPTRGRLEKLVQCLSHLAVQFVPDDIGMEILVIFDGGAADTVLHSITKLDARIRSMCVPAGGAAAARNAGIERATGELLIFLNDDCYPDDGWLTGHVQAQQAISDGGMCVGRTDWPSWKNETVFDALVRETSMVFFEAGMVAGHDYGFRHFWTCNTSVPAAAVRAVGGFDSRLRPVFFEDVELGYRLSQRGTAGVRYVPSARCVHDHRMSWEDYLAREAALGRMAAKLAVVNPVCFEAIFGYATLAEMTDDARAWLRLNERDSKKPAEFLSRQMSQLRRGGSDWPQFRDLLYFAHLPVKRATFRRALLTAVAEESGRSESQATTLSAQRSKQAATGLAS